MLFRFFMQQVSAMFLPPNSMEKPSGAPEFVQCFVRMHYLNTRDLHPRASRRRRVPGGSAGTGRGQAARGPGRARTKASPPFSRGFVNEPSAFQAPLPALPSGGAHWGFHRSLGATKEGAGTALRGSPAAHQSRAAAALPAAIASPGRQSPPAQSPAAEPSRAGMTPRSPSCSGGTARARSSGSGTCPCTARMPATNYTPVPRETENSTSRSHLDLMLLI